MDNKTLAVTYTLCGFVIGLGVGIEFMVAVIC